MKALPNHTCPLCGKPNDCAAAKYGRLDVDCWCNHTPVNPASLALVPPALRKKACLCRACATTPPTARHSPA
ncbi:MAG: DNA or RNA helicase of superfamily II [Verrucomicrobia bacterium]|nr:MAG: DNA or RNA helicase of superfamily II [Verrucomicrobiota bacterium]